MTTSITTNSVLQAIIEAQQAMDKLPAAEAELAKTKAELETTHRAWDESELKAMSLEDELKAMRATLATKEEALAAATFREQEVAHKLAVIQSVIGLPKQPEPVVVPVVTPLGEPSGEAATETAQGQGAEGPTASTTQVSTGENVDTHHATQSSDAGSAKDTSADPTPNQRDTDPTVDGGGAQSKGNMSQTAPSGDAQSGGNASAAERRPYWRKPADQSWADWTAAGNEPAPWLDREHNDPHTIAAK